jgi:D-alanyl-D-alanine carboxypeptidase
MAPAAIALDVDEVSEKYGGRAIVLYSQRGDQPAWSHVAGYQNGADGPLARWDDQVEIGSATIMFTAAAILLLEEDGALSLSDSLTTYFDESLLDDLSGGGGAKLQVRHLLTHTSGIGDYVNVGSDERVLTYYGITGERTYSPADLLELARNYTLHPTDYPELSILAPAFTLRSTGLDSYDELTHNSYSNTGYIMLGMIIEQASGLTYERFLHERIFGPLGMERTGLGTEGAKSTWIGHATGVTSEPVRTSPSFLWSAGAIVSTAPDMARFLRGAIGGKLFRNDATGEEWRTQDYIPLLGVLPYGRGLMRFYTYLGHVGQAFGAKFSGVYDPDKDHVVVVAIGDSQKIDEIRLSVLAQNSEP